MTPGELRTAVEAHGIPWPADPDRLPALLEARADEAPGEVGWSRLLLAGEQFRTARVPLPSGLRHEQLVRFDSFSATWTARDTDGSIRMVRAPRQEATPVQRRLVLRDGRALQELVPLRIVGNALVATPQGTRADAVTVGAAALLGRGLLALKGWEARGLGPLAPHPAEIRVDDASVTLCCLTPGPAVLAPWLSTVVTHLHHPGHPLESFLAGVRAMPPTSVDDAIDQLQQAMRDHLTAALVTLQTLRLTRQATDHRARLGLAIDKLAASIPKPSGRGAVGYDLNAMPTQVVSEAGTIAYGPVGEEAAFYTDDGFDAPAARRFLRACAAAPVNPALHDELGTDPGFTEQLSRWVAVRLRLRTLRLLLEKTA